MTRIAVVVLLDSDDPLFEQAAKPEDATVLAAVRAGSVATVLAVMQAREAMLMLSSHEIAMGNADLVEALGCAFGSGHRRRARMH